MGYRRIWAIGTPSASHGKAKMRWWIAARCARARSGCARGRARQNAGPVRSHAGWDTRPGVTTHRRQAELFVVVRDLGEDEARGEDAILEYQAENLRLLPSFLHLCSTDAGETEKSDETRHRRPTGEDATTTEQQSTRPSSLVVATPTSSSGEGSGAGRSGRAGLADG